MSSLRGGIFGRIRGKTGDIVFSQARTKRGTTNTIRQLVIPSNPNTTDQQVTRGRFGSIVNQLRIIGAPYWQTFYNRYLQQLPAFQSLVSTLMSSWNGSVYAALPAKRFESDVAVTELDNPATTDSKTLTIDFQANTIIGGGYWRLEVLGFMQDGNGGFNGVCAGIYDELQPSGDNGTVTLNVFNGGVTVSTPITLVCVPYSAVSGKRGTVFSKIVTFSAP